jgi:ABC-type multidrug transport system ATPase subunit
MKRRLNIGLALVHEPEILILDEPQAGLDPQSRILVREYIRSLAEKSTVILTTHDMDEADRLSDRIGIIDYGQLLVLDTPENLKSQIGAGDVLEIALPDGQEERLTSLQEALPPTARQLSYRAGMLRLVGADMLNAMPVESGQPIQEDHDREHQGLEDPESDADVCAVLCGAHVLLHCGSYDHVSGDCCQSRRRRDGPGAHRGDHRYQVAGRGDPP